MRSSSRRWLRPAFFYSNTLKVHPWEYFKLQLDIFNYKYIIYFISIML